MASALACHLINDQFGELVQKVCECLVEHKSLLLSEVARLTGIDVTPLGECLKLLIQHNCVQAFRIPLPDAAAKCNTFYMLILDNVLHRMRFPTFLALVHSDLGNEAQALVSALLQHGRLTFDQLLKRASECAQPGDVDVEMNVTKAFVDLVEAHYVERCPLPEPALAFAEEQPNKEQHVLGAAAQSDALRFRLPAILLQMRPEDLAAYSGHKLAKQMDTTNTDDKDVIWRVNYHEFLRRLRHEACVRLVKSRCDLGCGTVLACILDSSRTSERCLKQKLSSPLSMESIVQAVKKTEGGRCMSMERIRCALLQMSSHGFVIDRADDQYAIDVQRTLDIARQAEIEGIVLQKFGRKCCRIFRLLSAKGHLEHKQISDRSLVPSKDAWELLSKLVKERFVELEENDLNSRQWHVNLETVTLHVLNQMYQAAWSLNRRLSQELEQQEQEQDLDQARATVTGDDSRRNTGKVLKASMRVLDDAIMLFHDF